MAGKGAWLGAKTGFFLAICYTPLAMLILETSSDSDIIGLLIIGCVIGTFVGGLPASLVGALVGNLIGTQLSWLKEKPTQRQAILIGLGVAGGIILLINGLFSDPGLIVGAITQGDRPYNYSFTPLRSYAAFLALPSLICVVASGWMGQRLAAKWLGSPGSQSFAHLIPTNQLDPATFIRRQHQTTHRYEIDLALLRQGYSAEQIEEEWGKLGQRSRRKLQLDYLWRIVATYWLVIVLVGAGMLLVGWRVAISVFSVYGYCCMD